MPSRLSTQPINLSLFIGFIGSAMASPVVALSGNSFAGLLMFAQGLALVGYLASSLPTWAGWLDGSVLQRLTIIQGAIVAILAGNVAFFLSVEAGISQILCLLSAAAGGYGGDKVLVPLLNRLFGKVEKP